MQNLTAISITFTNEGHAFLNTGVFKPLVHVFVKNRRSDTSYSASGPDFATNLLAWNAVEAAFPPDINPYLGAKLGVEAAYEDGGTYDIQLRRQPFLPGEVILPVVDIHLYSTLYGLWAFNYTITFTFDDGHYSYSPQQDGIPSILLDTNNSNYSGICSEANTLPAVARPETRPVYLRSVRLDLGTHGKEKTASTKLGVHIANRLSATSSQDIAIATDLFDGQPFPQPVMASGRQFTNLKDFPGDKTIVFGEAADPVPIADTIQAPLASQTIQLQDFVLPMVYLTLAQTGADRWIFDYRVTYAFSNGLQFSSATSNVSLDANSNKHAGAYSGPPFPTYAPPGAESAPWPATVGPPYDKQISWSFLKARINELINERAEPLFKFYFDNTGDFGTGQYQSYYVFETITPDPPPPGTLSPPGYREPVTWSGDPSSLGFLANEAHFPHVELKTFALELDDNPSVALPITATLTFDTNTPFTIPYTVPVLGRQTMQVEEFFIQLKLTLVRDPDNQKIDVLRWVHDINTLTWTALQQYSGEFLGAPVQGQAGPGSLPADIIDSFVEQALVAHIKTLEGGDFGGSFQKTLRHRIFEMLSTPAPITHKSLADRINDYVNAWLLGGVVSGPHRSTVSDLHVDGDTLHIVYTGPTYEPPRPPDWPAGTDFTPGALANIEHIVVVTKENRSFDHMLGYLSLPISAGGQGRTDVDGLKGGESNPLRGDEHHSFAFEAQDTIFSPNPPQDPQRTLREIGQGRMDGFVEAFADASGVVIAPRIMGYHTAVNVPQFDALSRDFAICQRWFSPHPGSTFPNRFYQLTGRLNRTADGIPYTDNTIVVPELEFGSHVLAGSVQTIFDLLPETVSWRYFENGGYCFLRVFANHTFDSENIVPFDDSKNGFLALARRGALPNVSFIDPHFIDIPPDATCDEPPSDVRPGQDFVRQVVEAVVASPQWDKTLLIITYDEHGGFYDHVRPPEAARVTPESVATYGPRVPTFVVSPWVESGSVFGYDGPLVPDGGPAKPPATGSPEPETSPEPHPSAHPSAAAGMAAAVEPALPIGHSPVLGLHFDHTSILKTIVRCFASADPPYLGARYAAARDLSTILTPAPRKGPFRPFIPYTLVYANTTGALEVAQDSVAPGTVVRQNTPNAEAESQHFRFEDAGAGRWRLRTHAGTLYLTADATGRVMQEQKDAANAGQLWSLTTGVMPGAGFTISNAAHPEKRLQPQNGSANLGVAVVLGDPAPGPVGVPHVKNAWHVTSPRLPQTQVVINPS